MKKAAWIRLVSVFLIAALLFTGCGWNKVEGDDLRYPCKWKTKGKNTVVLEIKAGTAPEGYEWKTGEYDANILSVSDPAIDKKGNVKYTIESVNLGKTIVPFVCQSSDVLKTQDYELTVSLKKKDADSKLTVTDFQWNEPESHGGGEEWETPYSYSATEDGGVELIFAGGIEVDWTIKNYDKERLEVVGPYYEDDSCSFTLTGLSAGKCSFTVSSETAGYTLTLVLSVDQDGKITVESDEAKGNKK